MAKRNKKTLPEIKTDTPLRLAVAAKIAFPDGSITASSLRRENQRGRLEIERIAGKDYTTLANIERMRQLCRVERKPSDSGCDPNGVTATVTSVTLAGSSSTATSISPQAALRARLRQHKPNSPTMSRQNINPRAKRAT